MRINLKKCGHTVGDFAPGDIFMPIEEDTGYYMKVKPTSQYAIYNAVHLATGVLFTIDVNTPACYIDAILVDNERGSENG